MKRRPHRASGSAARLYVIAVTVAGAIVLAILELLSRPWDSVAHIDGFGWFLLGCLFVTELRPLSWIRKRSGAEVTASWTFGYALLLVGPAGLAIAGVCAASLSGDLIRRKPVGRALFNAAQLVLSLALGAAVLTLAMGSPVQPMNPSPGWVIAAAAAAVAIFASNGVLVGLVIALHSNREIAAVVKSVVALNLFTDGLLLAVAPIFVATGRHSMALVPLLFVSTWAVYRSACIAEARQYEANYDLLSELPNRRSFLEEARNAVRTADARNEALAVIMIDLDSFKAINDELGHHVGDLVLKEVGTRLNDACRPTDVVARLGGDEFAVLVRPIADANTARMLSERIILALEQPCLIRGIPVGIGASVGVSVFPQNGKDVDELMQRADVAMYAAKHDGGGIREYDPGHGRQSSGRLSLLSELSAAIENDQLRLEFQPKVHLSTGVCDSVEALVRWEHPVLGTIRPDEFVPMAEHTELMDPMTDWVIATALAHQRQWADAGVMLRVAVNASARNLHDLRFAQRVASRMLAAGADPKWLEIEITENAVMTDPMRVMNVLDAVHEMGIEISIDDFGTGYSSLTSLRNLPVSTVKIDRSFVSAMLSSESDRAIVRSIIDLAANLGLATVAEGIESAAVHYVLRDAGCRFGQGFLYSPPVPHHAVVALVGRGFLPSTWRESTAGVRP